MDSLTLLDLPDELLVEISDYLGVKELGRFLKSSGSIYHRLNPYVERKMKEGRETFYGFCFHSNGGWNTDADLITFRYEDLLDSIRSMRDTYGSDHAQSINAYRFRVVGDQVTVSQLQIDVKDPSRSQWLETLNDKHDECLFKGNTLHIKEFIGKCIDDINDKGAQRLLTHPYIRKVFIQILKDGHQWITTASEGRKIFWSERNDNPLHPLMGDNYFINSFYPRCQHLLSTITDVAFFRELVVELLALNVNLI